MIRVARYLVTIEIDPDNQRYPDEDHTLPDAETVHSALVYGLQYEQIRTDLGDENVDVRQLNETREQ